MTGTTPVISDTIRHLCNEGLTTQVELAGVAGVSESTISRWSADVGGPDFAHVCRWIGFHPRLDVRRAFRRCVPLVDEPADGDINHDGVVDFRDVIEGSAELVLNTGRMNYIITAATRDGEISHHEATAICAAGDQCISLGKALIQAADCSAVRRRQAVKR